MHRRTYITQRKIEDPRGTPSYPSAETTTPKRVGNPLTTSRPQLRQQPEQQQLSTFYRHQRRQWQDRQLHRQEVQQRWSTATSLFSQGIRVEMYRWRATREALRHRISPCQLQLQQLPCQWSRAQTPRDKQCIISLETTSARENDCWTACVLEESTEDWQHVSGLETPAEAEPSTMAALSTPRVQCTATSQANFFFSRKLHLDE